MRTAPFLHAPLTFLSQAWFSCRLSWWPQPERVSASSADGGAGSSWGGEPSWWVTAGWFSLLGPEACHILEPPVSWAGCGKWKWAGCGLNWQKWSKSLISGGCQGYWGVGEALIIVHPDGHSKPAAFFIAPTSTTITHSVTERQQQSDRKPFVSK